MEELALGLVFAVAVLDGQDPIAQHVNFRIIIALILLCVNIHKSFIQLPKISYHIDSLQCFLKLCLKFTSSPTYVYVHYM